MITQPDLDADLKMKLFAGLEVVKSQQSEINRRLGKLEKAIEERLVDPARVQELEDWREEVSDKRGEWFTWAVQIIGGIILYTLMSWIGSGLGVDLKW